MALKKMQTKELSSSGVISTEGKSAIIRAISLRSGTTDSSITIQDGGSGGTEKWALSCDGTTAAEETTTSISFGEYGFICTTDAYGTLVGTSAKADILYDEIEA